MAAHASDTVVLDEASGDTLSPEEVRVAIERLSDLDWLRVKKAALYFSGRSGREWRELQNEALVRTLDGRRNCPRRVRVTTFLSNVIRSIASEDDELDGHIVLSPKIEAQQATPEGLISLSEPADPAASSMDAHSLMEEAVGCLGGDHIAELLFEGDLEGKEGQELREFLGLSQTEFDSKRRYVKRRLNKHFEGKSR